MQRKARRPACGARARKTESGFACFFRIFRYNGRMKKVFLIFLTTLFCFNGFTQEISDETTDSIDEETQRNLKEARRNLSELFLIMTEELKTPDDGKSVPESTLELTDDEKIEMAAELLELPVETVRRFAAEQKEPAAEETPAGETKVKSFISDKSLTVYDADNETLEIPAVEVLMPGLFTTPIMKRLKFLPKLFLQPKKNWNLISNSLPTNASF